MEILLTIDRCFNMIPGEIVESGILYVELDKDSYSKALEEAKMLTNGGISLIEQKITDIGSCIMINFTKGKALLILDKEKEGQDTFYVAFKTKII